MNNRKYIIVLTLLAFFAASCTDYLDPYPNGDRSDEDIWKYPEMAQGLVGQVYDYIPNNYNTFEGAYLDCATDNAVETNTSGFMRNIAIGSWTTNNDPFAQFWERDYAAIASVNRFLEDHKGFNTRYLVEPLLDSLLRHRLQGEAFGLRAWFYWDLLKKFGGKANGNLLGVPLVTEVFPNITDQIDLPRASYDATVQQILTDLDSAYVHLPIAYRDFLTPSNFQTILGSRGYGRVSGIVTKAMKADIYLTWASPTFNPGQDITRWENAAKFAKEVMDFKLQVDNVNKGFNAKSAVNWVHPEFPAFIWAVRYQNGNDSMERMFYPGGFQGNGVMGPTQELIDAYPMANGYPIDHPMSGYDPQNPYANRDPRFYSEIFYNGATANKNNGSQVMYTFETYNGGKDVAFAKPDNTRTNYYIKKFVYMGLNWSDNSIDRQRHTKAIYRWAHMVLTFAEAANEIEGPNGSKYGLSAKEAMAYLRTRDSDAGAGFTTDPYLDEVASDKDSFREFIRNERRIITAFEGMRFYDLRRWGAQLNEVVHAPEITKTGGDTYSYDLNKEVEPRSFPSLFIPLPYEEVVRMPELVQNDGWESFQ